MTLQDSIGGSEHCVLVEGPRWADTEFYAKWLLAAAKANALWKKVISDRLFERQIERLMVVRIPEFNIRAMVLLSRFEKNLASITIDEDSVEVEDFAMMVGWDSLCSPVNVTRWWFPARLNIDKIKKAALKLAQTEDEEYNLHPEYFLAIMSYSEARHGRSGFVKWTRTIAAPIGS